MKKRISLVLQQGKPAVLSTESIKAYKELVDWYELTFDPLDPYEVALVRDLIDATFETDRYARLKVALIESKVLALRELEAKRAQASAEKKEVVAKRLAAKSSAPASEPEEAFDHLVEEVDAVLLEPVNELEYARAFQTVLAEYEIINKLQMLSIARRDNAIAALERYREGIGNRRNEMMKELMACSDAEITTQRFPSIDDPAEDWVEWLAEPEKKPAPAEASAADAQKSIPAKPESEPQPVCEAATTTDTQPATVHPQKFAALPDAPHAQPGGVDKEPAPIDASAAPDAQKLAPAKPEGEPQPAREAPSATKEQPQ
jgi:hypothetical protein